jgi:hypothetical protein
MEFNGNFDDPEFFEEAHISNVDMEATTNVTVSRCHRQGTFSVLYIFCYYSQVAILFFQTNLFTIYTCKLLLICRISF